MAVEILHRTDMCFIVMRRVVNRPGVAALIAEALENAGINVESFQAVAHPRSRTADIVMLGVSSADMNEAIRRIKMADGRVGGSIMVIKDITGIVIRGRGFTETPGILRRAFKTCEQLGVNIVTASTTAISLNIYINSADFSRTLIEELHAAFEAL